MQIFGGCNPSVYVVVHARSFVCEHGKRKVSFFGSRRVGEAPNERTGERARDDVDREESRLRGRGVHRHIGAGGPAAGPAAAPAVTIERLRSPHAVSRAFVRACRRYLGAATAAPPEQDGPPPPQHALHAPSEGAGLHWVTISGGVRRSNATCLLRSARAAASRAGGALRIRTGCRVLKVLLERAEGADAPHAQPAAPHTP